MQDNESAMTPKNQSTIISNTESNKNDDINSKNEISQIFNKVYDSTFLSMINELSISIQNYHKNFLYLSNMIKSLFNEITKENENDILEKIKSSFNQIDLLSSKFYSDAKLSFKKMKIYRNNIIKNNNPPQLKYKHKKYVSINIKRENNNSLTGQSDEIKYKKIFITKENSNIKNNLFKDENIQNNTNHIHTIEQNEKINLQNYFSNKSSNSYTLNQSSNISLDQETNYSLAENNNEIDIFPLVEFWNNIVIDLKSINLKDDNEKLNKFIEEKKEYLINSIKNIFNKTKEKIPSIENKEIKDNLCNKISILEEENNKIKQQFEKFKSDEKIKRKFLENQILNFSKKEKENIKSMKLKENEFQEKITQLNSKIIDIDEQIKQKTKTIEEKNEEIKSIKINHEKIMSEKQQQYQIELNNLNKIKDNELILIKEEKEKLLKCLNEKDNTIKNLSLTNEDNLKSIKIKENELLQLNQIIKETKENNSKLNEDCINNNKNISLLKSKINDYEKDIISKQEELAKQIHLIEDANKKYNNLKALNNKYTKTIKELEEENKEINNLLIENKSKEKTEKNILNKKIEELNIEINALNSQLDHKDKDIGLLNKKIEEKENSINEYKNKYDKLEKSLQEYKSKEEEENLTEYENKKRKIPIRKKRISTNNEIENVEKKFRFLFRTMENFNPSKSRNNSRKNLNNLNDSSSIVKKNTFTRMKTLDDKKNIDNNEKMSNYSNKNLNNKKIYNNTDYNEDKEESSTNTYNTNNIENSVDNAYIKITPDNYKLIKLYEYNNKFKWCLFAKIKNKKQSLISQGKPHYRRYSFGRESTQKSSISNTIEIDLYNYEDFIWLPYKTNSDFSEFKEINDNIDMKNEKREDINEFKSIIKNLENKLIEKEKDYTKLDNIFVKLVQENKNYKNNIEKLIKENIDLNEQISKYNNDLKNDKNFIGVSFIDDDPESSKFIDDKCCEDILIGLDKGKNSNKSKKQSCYSNNLKYCIDMLMTKVVPSENIRSLLATILRQLGCSDDDIHKLLGNYRGVISIPFSSNKLYK